MKPLKTLLYLAFLWILVAVTSCASSGEILPLRKAVKGSTFNDDGEYRLGVNDVIEMKVAGQPDYNGNYVISQSGVLNLPLTGSIQARGMTERQLLRVLEGRLRNYIKNPVITLSIISYESYKVFISGTVRNPGVFIFKESTTIVQAIAVAGGLTPLSNGEIILHRKKPNGVIGKYTVDYDDLIRGPASIASFVLERGDVLYVQ
ncbi:polysaccharide biosynthesis/export family protein [Pseudobacteriovorax antillogorgiicola]|uniref:Polysaccharide export outer membrane protein n=1 Tax=Pseudobacteriovorax antillogorgiicola TaxID=1513793 RepID=A0A1Y6BMN5_9BACT|nr:polysaccharide biosynthesis/export family protein [Pseudobacteriovorax antillogorgiicola]TCS54552.1 polysaccharide export outer membrane protein [Pseudobacteriovorax antillogorgiicola]SMF18456.1 polysaccharide export outer membrane protein [Pseudobacteriovorax antillogorgiicola]